MSENYEHLTYENLEGVARLARELEEVTSDSAYITGSVEVWHFNGFRLGFLHQHEDWWYFEPSYEEPVRQAKDWTGKLTIDG